MYIRKTKDIWVIESNFGDGWETETNELTKKAAHEQARIYRENSPYPIRVRKIREKIQRGGTA